MGEFIESVSLTTWVILIIWVILTLITISWLKNVDCEDLNLTEDECCQLKSYSGWIFGILLIIFVYWLGSHDGRAYMRRVSV